jgi:hypothetical protein
VLAPRPRPEELKAFPARGVDTAPAPDQRILREQRGFDRKDVIARDVPDGVDALEDNVQGEFDFGTSAMSNP